MHTYNKIWFECSMILLELLLLYIRNCLQS